MGAFDNTNMDDILAQIYAHAHPELTEAEIKAQIANAPSDAKQSIGASLGATPPQAPISMASQPSTDNFPGLNSTPSSYDVGVSDNTVTQNGSQASVAPSAPSMPSLPQNPSPVSAPQTPEAPAPMAPTPAAPAPKPAAAPATPPVAPAPVATPMGTDQQRRDAELAAIEHQRRMKSIPGAIAGIGDAIAQGGQALGLHGPTDTQSKILEGAKTEEASQKGDLELKLKRDPNSDVSKSYRQMVLQIAPDMAKKPDFTSMSAQDIGDKLPLIDTMMKARAQEDSKKLGLAQIKSNRDLGMAFKQSQEQDRLEQNARMGVQNLRGDKSLARAEEQRDAAAVAYNRLTEIQKSGKGLNPIDYTDILGQIYKARTGNSPGEEVLKQIRQSTAEGNLGKAYTYITGQQAPATSQDITNSLKSMAQSMGMQADKFHDGYMKAHLIKPSGLDDSRWQPILQTGRGMSFSEATKQNSQPTGGARKTASGISYSVE